MRTDEERVRLSAAPGARDLFDKQVATREVPITQLEPGTLIRSGIDREAADLGKRLCGLMDT